MGHRETAGERGLCWSDLAGTPRRCVVRKAKVWGERWSSTSATMIWATDWVMPGSPCQGVPGVSPTGAAFAVRLKTKTSEKLSLARILADLFIVLIHLARAGEVEHSNNCEPTIAEAFGTVRL